MTVPNFLPHSHRLAALCAVLLACACVQVPSAPEQIQAADISIRLAEDSQAGNHAAPELATARENLAQAKDTRGYQARKYAVAAKLDAELAASKAEAARAEMASAESQKAIEFMRLEMELKKAPASAPNPATTTPPTTQPYGDGQ